MKRILPLILACLILIGCAPATVAEVTIPETTEVLQPQSVYAASEYASQYLKETRIFLSDDGITVEGNQESVTTSRDIVYYQDRDTYDSGYPYGEGTDADKHTAEEADAHTVVNITQPGAYRVSGKLSAGQIRVDLGSNAYYDPEAVVELILDDADITCTVAPAILFRNVYECDGQWSVDTASAQVDTSAAGANLILEGSNTVTGSHVAKIFQDTEDEKKLWKQDGAIYSYMSMNVYGPGTLELTADNEGLDTELHLTINGGNIRIHSENDGINTNEDGVSVTTINGGNVNITAGLGQEGDGIDSNGYLVINGGTVVASANPAADAGLDSDLGSFIHGGTVIALGSAMDWAESDSGQVTMNLQFVRQQAAGAKITVTRTDGTQIFTFEDDGPSARPFSGMILSHFGFAQGESYNIYIDGVLQSYGGNDLRGGMGFGGGRGGMGQRPGFSGDQAPEEMPQNFRELPEGETMPEGFDPSRMEGRENRVPPEGETMPEGFDPSQMEGRGQRPEDDRKIPAMPEGEAFPAGTGGSTEFYMEDKVNAFSGITAGA